MPKSVNKVILIGNVGKDPEVRNSQSGTPVANFSLATNERFKDQNDAWQDRTHVLWILRATDFPLVASPALNFLIDPTAAQEPYERACIHSAADRRSTI